MPPIARLQEMYEDMVTARYYEERLWEEYLEGKQPAFESPPGRSRANSTWQPARKRPPPVSASTSGTRKR